MNIIEEQIYLCSDCLQAAVNDDYSGLDYSYSEPESTQKMQAIQAGLSRLGPHLTYKEDSGFMSQGCDCCNDGMAGDKFEFIILG